MSKPEVFLSYSTSDGVSCDRIEHALVAADCTVWRDVRSIAPGSSWVKSIFRGINSADFVVPLLSQNSLQSPWVAREVETALAKSLTKASPLSIIPVLLEPVRIPEELTVLQCIDLSSDFETGLAKLVNSIGRTSTTPSLPGLEESYSTSISGMADSLFGIFDPNKGIPQPSQLELWQLHQHLIRLQAVVEQIARMSPETADGLWRIAGEMMPSPIPAVEEVVNQANRTYLLSYEKDNEERMKISLLSRYLSIMGDVVKSVRSSVLMSIPITNPGLADELTKLFQSKVSIYRSVQRLRDESKEQEHHNYDDLLDYIEAARTLESRGLLQLIDADARSVARKGPMGMTIFAEMATQGAQIIQAIQDLRRRIGALLKNVGFTPGDSRGT